MTFESVALLVDGDNISSAFADDILAAAEKLGTVRIRRVYGNFASLTKWRDTPTLCPEFAGTGKNGADILIAIDAMEIAFRQSIDAFVIATSDRDLSHLAVRLRENGQHVLGLGEDKCPDIFRDACSNFEELRAKAKSATTPKTLSDSEVCRMLKSLIQAGSTQGRGLSLKDLGTRMSSEHGVTLASLGLKSWREFLKRHPEKFVIDEKGENRDQAYVRFLHKGFAT